ncbi:MAG: hypothetical protein K8R76_05940 [Candidatus Aegiribacteria sp.]|nr:hypothetical protein [Candidatus Aegiribacteria sp.]
MKTSIIFVLFQISFFVTAGIPVELGPVGRIVFPLSKSPIVIQTSEDFNGSFSSDGPVILAGAVVRIRLIPPLPVEVSGLFGEYDPYFEYSDEYADSTGIEFCKGSLAIVTLGFQKNLGDIVLLAGSDIYAYHERWIEIDGTGWGGYHREANNTTIAPYIGTCIGVDFHTVEFDFDIRLHFPDLTDRWLSAGCSLLFM